VSVEVQPDADQLFAAIEPDRSRMLQFVHRTAGFGVLHEKFHMGKRVNLHFFIGINA